MTGWMVLTASISPQTDAKLLFQLDGHATRPTFSRRDREETSDHGYGWQAG